MQNCYLTETPRATLLRIISGASLLYQIKLSEKHASINVTFVLSNICHLWNIIEHERINILFYLSISSRGTINLAFNNSGNCLSEVWVVPIFTLPYRHFSLDDKLLACLFSNSSFLMGILSEKDLKWKWGNTSWTCVLGHQVARGADSISSSWGRQGNIPRNNERQADAQELFTTSRQQAAPTTQQQQARPRLPLFYLPLSIGPARSRSLTPVLFGFPG